MVQRSFHSPYGDLTLTEEVGAIISLDWGWARDQDDSSLLQEGIDQLNAYFDGDRHAFSLPLAPQGTAFQQKIWHALHEIPYGETRRYGELATATKSGARPVGTACGRNPIPIIIPCHRVLAANGMGGYSGAGGLDTKIQLLRLEGALL